MIPIPSGVRVWIATGHTDMRRGMQSLALTVQESLKRDPHAGDLYIFRGRRGDLVKILWHDGLGKSLYAFLRDTRARRRECPPELHQQLTLRAGVMVAFCIEHQVGSREGPVGPAGFV